MSDAPGPSVTQGEVWTAQQWNAFFASLAGKVDAAGGSATNLIISGGSTPGVDLSVGTVLTAGTSAARALANRFAESVNVLDQAGATSSAAFAAFSAAATLAGSTGIAVYVPDGIYNTGTTAWIPSGVESSWRFGKVQFVPGSGQFQYSTDPAPFVSAMGIEQGFIRSTATAGTGFCFAGQLNISDNTGTANEEKATAYITAKTSAVSTYTYLGTTPDGCPSYTQAVFKDCVGAHIAGIIAAGNTAGRAWGLNFGVTVEAGADGSAVGAEVDLVNNGSFQPLLSQPNSKAGFSIISMGAFAGTSGLVIAGSPGWQDGIVCLQSNILGNAFRVLKSGYGNTDVAHITNNGVALFSGLNLGAAVAATNWDTTRHIQVFGLGAAGSEFGFGVTSGRFNYIAGSGGVHTFVVGETDALSLNGSGDLWTESGVYKTAASAIEFSVGSGNFPTVYGGSTYAFYGATGANAGVCLQVNGSGTIQLNGASVSASGPVYATSLIAVSGGVAATGGVNTDTLSVTTTLTPASSSAPGVKGQIGFDATYIYVCTATNTWRRVAHSTW